TGARRPASRPTSTKRAWKGRPEGADLGNGLALCVDSPCLRSDSVPRQQAAPIPNRANFRRVIGLCTRSPWKFIRLPPDSFLLLKGQPPTIISHCWVFPSPPGRIESQCSDPVP